MISMPRYKVRRRLFLELGMPQKRGDVVEISEEEAKRYPEDLELVQEKMVSSSFKKETAKREYEKKEK